MHTDRFVDDAPFRWDSDDSSLETPDNDFHGNLTVGANKQTTAAPIQPAPENVCRAFSLCKRQY